MHRMITKFHSTLTLVWCRATTPLASLHTTLPLAYSAQDKRARDTIKKHSKKSTLKPVEVRANMTVRELADAMGKPVQHVYDCMRQIRLSWSIRGQRDSTPLPSLDAITKVRIKKSGHSFQLGF